MDPTTSGARRGAVGDADHFLLAIGKKISYTRAYLEPRALGIEGLPAQKAGGGKGRREGGKVGMSFRISDMHFWLGSHDHQESAGDNQGSWRRGR